MTYRVGTGFDAHRLVEGRALVLGGVTIEHDRGLEGHSDADIVCHALIDAVLGASALGDIGDLFPPDDPRFAGAASIELLARAWRDVAAVGYELVNCDAVVVRTAPRIAPHRDEMRERIALAIGASRPGVRARHRHGRPGLRGARRWRGVPGGPAPRAP